MAAGNGNDNQAQKLIDLKKSIDQSRQDVAKLQGQLSAFNGELKKIGINSIEEAEAELTKLSTSISKKQKSFDSLYKEIQDAL